MPQKLAYNSYNPEILKSIFKVKNVLDIGCGTGLLAEQIKNGQKCFIVGIEKNTEAASFASKRCDKVIIDDIERLKELPFPDNYFDCIVLADVLEHTKNPEEILNNIKRYISKDGFMLISLPNVAHWRMRLKLMLCRFDYQERGTLDRTHLKFFTLNTFKELLESCGLKIVHLSGHGNFLANIFKGIFASFFVAKASLAVK